tara:strand:+ start:6947 stop:7717 length:771 start_codon:yes stop_codon:yes gene_type:complete
MELNEFDFKTLKDYKKNMFITVNGASKSGKGYWVNEAIYWRNKAMKYKHAFLFSSTAHIQLPKQFPFVPDAHRFTDLENMEKIISRRMKTKSRDNILIICDDVSSMTESGKMFKNSVSMRNLACYSRHCSIDVFNLLQRCQMASPLMRNCSSIVVNFLPKSARDLKMVKDNYLSLAGSKRDIDEVFKNIFSKSYQALVCNQTISGTIQLQDYAFKSTAPPKLRKYRLKLYQNKSKKTKKNNENKNHYRIYINDNKV